MFGFTFLREPEGEVAAAVVISISSVSSIAVAVAAAVVAVTVVTAATVLTAEVSLDELPVELSNLYNFFSKSL
jgi:hypothetical protein